MGIGILLLVIEFKTPGFGFIGFSGLALMLVVFAGNYVAGLAGYEVVIFFILGLALIALEVILFPGAMVFVISGMLLALGAMLWSMADLWPRPGGGIDIRWEAFIQPLTELSLSICISAAGLVVLWRYLPTTSLYRPMTLPDAIAAPAPAMAHGGTASSQLPAIGDLGTVVHDLRPLGVVDIQGQRFEARCRIGTVESGRAIRVTGYSQFTLLVEPTP